MHIAVPRLVTASMSMLGGLGGCAGACGGLRGGNLGPRTAYGAEWWRIVAQIQQNVPRIAKSENQSNCPVSQSL